MTDAAPLKTGQTPRERVGGVTPGTAMATKVLIFSQVLSCFFVGSVTFWYMLTPYLVKPHPDIINDM